MNNPLPIAVRATAAALAVFMTIAVLSSLISIAEPQQSQLIAQSAARTAAHAALTTPQVLVIAQAQ
jgi:hypothetical protein